MEAKLPSLSSAFLILMNIAESLPLGFIQIYNSANKTGDSLFPTPLPTPRVYKLESLPIWDTENDLKKRNAEIKSYHSLA